MEMNFPHPRSGDETGTTRADYFALVASAMSRQATSSTVRALLRGPGNLAGESDILESRINFFARSEARAQRQTRGAFLPSLRNEFTTPPAKFESAVNPADSTNGKNDELETVQPESQVAERGTEF
jgi:hypothetical protein